MNKKAFYILPLLFLGMILLGVLNNLFSFWEFPQKDENRNFSEKPVFNIQNLDPYPKQFEAYYNDHFSFRSPMLDMFHYMKYYFFKTPAHPDKTAIGKDGWCFDADKAKGIYEGDLDFNSVQYEKFKKVWRERKAYFDSKNIKLLWVIAPMKHYVYEEELPINFIKSKTRRTDEVIKMLSPEFPGLTLDPLPALRAAKDSMKLFYKLDNHLNLRAGLIISQLIVERLQAYYPQLQQIPYDSFTWKEKLIQAGNHYVDVGIGELSETDLFPTPKSAFYSKADLYDLPIPPDFAYPDMYQHRFFQPKNTRNLPRILVIMDSFGERLMPFIPYSFGESLFIFDNWKYRLDKNLIERVKPDIVVYMTFEKLLHHIIGEQ